MSIDFTQQVAIITGAGNGLGKSHALALAARGARVMVNDIGSTQNNNHAPSASALQTVEMITDAGGEAVANTADVRCADQVDDMVGQCIARWGKVDILVNNAGILRDKSFAKMDVADFRHVLDVHLMGSVHCCKAVWPYMLQQQYGRIVMTSSSSGLFGNFGQANYGAAKMALIGLMNTLVLEGQKYNIKINTLAPAAATAMTEGLIPADILPLMTSEPVSAALLALCHKESPNGYILCAGAGTYNTAHIVSNEGLHLSMSKQTPESIMQHWSTIANSQHATPLPNGNEHVHRLVQRALDALKQP